MVKGGLSRLVALAGSSNSRGGGGGGGGSRIEGSSLQPDSENQSTNQSHSPATPRRIAGFVSQSSTISSSATTSSSIKTFTPTPQPLQIQLPESSDTPLIDHDPITKTTTEASTSTLNANIAADTPSQTGETWTLIQGEEIQEAEREFKGLDIKDTREGEGEGRKGDSGQGGNGWKGKEKVGKEVIKNDILEILAGEWLFFRGFDRICIVDIIDGALWRISKIRYIR
jgi:hypothetical protein